MKTEKFSVTGMTCAACQANVTRQVQRVPGVKEVNVSLLSNQMTVSFQEDETGKTRSSMRWKKSGMARRRCKKRQKKKEKRTVSVRTGTGGRGGRKKSRRI